MPIMEIIIYALSVAGTISAVLLDRGPENQSLKRVRVITFFGAGHNRAP